MTTCTQTGVYIYSL